MTVPNQIVKNIVVIGGNGFLGKRICQQAIEKGYSVTSISGSGKKPTPYRNEDSNWMQKVNWLKGNVFEPSTYKPLLIDATAVVSTIGILFENDQYKRTVSSGDGILGLVSQIFKSSTINPMEKRPPTVDSEGAIDITYERYNTESAIVAAESLIEAKSEVKSSEDVKKIAPAFVYISADRGFPGIPMGYIESKRKAEFELYQLQPFIRPIILRPGFMYDPSEKESTNLRSKLKKALDGVNLVNEKLLRNALDGIVRPNISTVTVAKWCIDRIENESFHGPVMLDEMINIQK